MTVAEDWQPVVADGSASPFRRRLLDGLAASIRERGYRDTTVADIVRHARTSKRTFYGEFSSKEECFVELLWAGNQEMIARIRAAVDPEADWRDQIRQAVEAWVADIEARPAVTLSWIRELPALGHDVRAVQRRGMAAVTDMFIDMSNNPGFRRAQHRADNPPDGRAVVRRAPRVERANGRRRRRRPRHRRDRGRRVDCHPRRGPDP